MKKTLKNKKLISIFTFCLISSLALTISIFINHKQSNNAENNKYKLELSIPEILKSEESNDTYYHLTHSLSYRYIEPCNSSGKVIFNEEFKDIDFYVEFISSEKLEYFDPKKPETFNDAPYYYGFAKSIYKDEGLEIYSLEEINNKDFLSYTLGSHGCDTLYYFYKVTNHGVLVIQKDLVEELDGLSYEIEPHQPDKFSYIKGVITDKSERDSIFSNTLKSIVIKKGETEILKF